ncbi:MAG: RHS repeat-associated core domain-containing protein, partial [Sulfuricaulis sp.]
AWGKRRNGNWTDATSAITSLTHHGFTGHEMLDDVGLINMNGRIYDPTLARFLSADPTVQSPGNPQTLNRYTYANNNPLTYTDPSGYGWFSNLWKSVIRPLIAIVAAAFVGAYLYGALIWSSFGAAFGAVGTGIFAGAVGGFVGGIIGSGGNLQAGLYGAMTGAIFGGIGAYADGQMTPGMDPAKDPWADGGMNRVIAHAVGGGVSSKLQGQKFGPGALAAGFSETFSPGINKLGGRGVTVGGTIERTVASAVVGGTASVLGGGNFANGAKTAAFARLFNETIEGLVERGDTHIQQTRGGWADEQIYGPEHNLTQDKMSEGSCEVICTPLEIAAELNPLSPDRVDTGIKASELAGDAARLSANSTMSNIGKVIGFTVPIVKGFQFFSVYQEAKGLCAYSCAHQDVYK